MARKVAWNKDRFPGILTAPQESLCIILESEEMFLIDILLDD